VHVHAVAKLSGQPRFFIGRDFSKTDLEPA
jgi:uncharacterized protein with PIN domain